MALIFHSGFEMGDFGEWAGVDGEPTISDTIKKTGNYASKHGILSCLDAGLGSSIKRARGWFYFSELSVFSARLIGGYGTNELSITVNEDDDKHVHLWESNSKVDKGDTVIAPGSWHEIEIVKSGTTAKVFVNGNEECSATVDVDCYIPAKIGYNNQVQWVYADDIIFDDAESLEILGDIRVLRSQPDADGTNTDFEFREPTNGRPYFGLVDECPASDDDYVYADGDADEEETLDLEERSVLETAYGAPASGDTINAVSVWCRMDKGTGKASTHQLVVYDGTTNYEYEVTFSKSFGWKNQYYAAKPGGGAWDWTIFDLLEAGAGNAGDGAQETYLSCVMVMVAYTPAAPAGWTGKISGVTNPAKIMGVPVANIAKVKGVA